MHWVTRPWHPMSDSINSFLNEGVTVALVYRAIFIGWLQPFLDAAPVHVRYIPPHVIGCYAPVHLLLSHILLCESAALNATIRTTQDLLFLDDGNPTDVPGTQMHNFDKMRMIAQVVLKQQEYGLCLRSGWVFFFPCDKFLVMDMARCTSWLRQAG
jgi:hypothetical protein